MSELKYIFGPAPSRRLGRSLGINVVPAKLCSLDCAYCEVGRTRGTSVVRKEYSPASDIIEEFQINYPYFAENTDVITITGYGEPTLNSKLREILAGVKKHASGKPVAILTNATLINDPEVFDTLLSFDIVLPSLDAASQETFEKVDAPHKTLRYENIANGIREFSHRYHGALYLEILLCEGLNDSEKDVEDLALAMRGMKLAKVQVGTVHRPPAYSRAKPVSDERILEIVKRFRKDGLPAEMSAGFKNAWHNISSDAGIKEKTASLIKFRPCTIADIAGVFGISGEEAAACLESLGKENEAETSTFNGEKYYSHPELIAGKEKKD